MHIILSILLSIGKAIQQTAQTGKTDDKAIERSLQLDMVEDEMDKLIPLKSMRAGYAIGGLGFIAALISLVMGSPSGAMLNIMFGSFFAGSLIGIPSPAGVLPAGHQKQLSGHKTKHRKEG